MVVKAARAVEDNLVVAENEAFTGGLNGSLRSCTTTGGGYCRVLMCFRGLLWDPGSV